jgi:phenylalanyl-tRNA synthetase beta chain
VTAAGARSINNVVDVTNYVMFLLGQPLHAFDLDTLKGADGQAHIIVRPAHEGEAFTTLDGEARRLSADMTVIATPERAVALAGVMGGLETEVNADTTDILLEAATFSPSHTSRTSRSLGLISESSLRYERGVDAAPIAENVALAAALMAEVAGGEVCEGVIDQWPLVTLPHELEFRINRFTALAGADIPQSFIKETLERLGCTVRQAEASVTPALESLTVTAPTFRPDLEREIDLFEEVLRVYGMDRIPPTLPGGRGRVGCRTQREHAIEIVHASLRASGLNEAMTYSFAEPSDLDRLRMAHDGLGLAVELVNPLNAEQSHMRQSIIPGLLRSVAHNQNHAVRNIQLYEIGAVFMGTEGKKKPKEKTRVAGVLAGSMADATWNSKPEPFDFFDGKGVIENLCRELAIPKLRFKAFGAQDAPHLQPGRGAEVLSGGTSLGWVGELHPLAIAAFEAQAPVTAFELDMSALVKAGRPARDFTDIAVFPAVCVDVAFVVDENVTHERMMQCLASAGGSLLEQASLFDVYRDEARVGTGKKSLAYSLVYRAPDRTLTGAEVEAAHERIISKVMGATGAQVRA